MGKPKTWEEIKAERIAKEANRNNIPKDSKQSIVKTGNSVQLPDKTWETIKAERMGNPPRAVDTKNINDNIRKTLSQFTPAQNTQTKPVEVSPAVQRAVKSGVSNALNEFSPSAINTASKDKKRNERTEAANANHSNAILEFKKAHPEYVDSKKMPGMESPTGYKSYETIVNEYNHAKNTNRDHGISGGYILGQATGKETEIPVGKKDPVYEQGENFSRLRLKYKIGELTDDEGLAWSHAIDSKDSRLALEKTKELQDLIAQNPWITEEPEYKEWYKKPGGFISSALDAAAEMAPIMIRSQIAGAKLGVPAAIGAMGTAAMIGQAGPQIAAPEEIITMPAAAIAGFKTGAMGGAADHMFHVERGLSFKTMVQNGVTPEVASTWSTVVGVANAGIEMAQIGTWLKSFKGLGAAIQAAENLPIGQFLTTVGKAHLAKLAKGVATETGQEVAQEMVSIAGEAGADNQMGRDVNLLKKENADRLIQTAIQSAKAFLVMQGGGQIVGGTYRAAVSQSEKNVMRAINELNDTNVLSQTDTQTVLELEETVRSLSEQTDEPFFSDALQKIEGIKYKLADMQNVPQLQNQAAESGPNVVQDVAQTDGPVKYSPKEPKIISAKFDAKEEPKAPVQKQPLKGDYPVGTQLDTTKYGPITVVDSSDGAFLRVKNQNGTELSIGRKALSDILVQGPVIETQQPIAQPIKSVVEPTAAPKNTYEVYQGRGKTRDEIYTGTKHPVLGDAQYYALNEGNAKRYGDDVTKSSISLDNPIVIKDDADWKRLTVDAGWKFAKLTPGLDGNVELIEALKKHITSKGHDGVIIQYEDFINGDINRITQNPIKTLQDMFGHDQIVSYKDAVKVAPATESTATKEQVAVDRFVDSMMKSDDYAERYGKEAAIAAAYGLIDDINNKNFLSLKDRLHSGNKNSLKLFSDVTGLPTGNNKINSDSIRALDPKKYDEWVDGRKKLEASRIESEKQAEYDAVGQSKVPGYSKYNTKSLFEKFIEDGYRLEYSNEQFGKFVFSRWVGDDYQTVDPMKIFDGTQRKWIRETYKTIEADLKERDAAAKKAEYDALSPEEKKDADAIKALFNGGSMAEVIKGINNTNETTKDGGNNAKPNLLEEQNNGLSDRGKTNLPETTEKDPSVGGTRKPRESTGTGERVGSTSTVNGQKSDNEVLGEEPGVNNTGRKPNIRNVVERHDGGDSVGLDPTNDLNHRFENFDIDNIKPNASANLDALKLMRKIIAEGRQATPDEQKTLAKYKGWGALKQTLVAQSRGWNRDLYELKELVSAKEFQAIQSSMRNAHYTAVELASIMYDGLKTMGFNGGRILEPSMGAGNFFGVIPESLNRSKLYGVELDTVTGNIAKLLYPQANIQIAGYQDVQFKDNFFDVAIGNVPFGDTTLTYKGKNYLLHDFFFVKTADKLREGGVMAFITSTGTMDKISPKLRNKLAETMDLVTAVRLPSTTFAKNAGTEVTTDLIILRKRETGKPSNGVDWLSIGKINGIPVNQYYVDNPNNMLGELVYEKNMYGGERAQLRANDTDYKESLKKIMGNLPKVMSASNEVVKVKANQVENTFGYDKYSFVTHDGNLYYVDGDVMKPIKSNVKKIQDYMAIKETFKGLLGSKNKNADRIKLNNLYDAFVSEHGPLQSKANKALREDTDFDKVSGLEKMNPTTKEIEKSEIFTKDTTTKKVVERAETSYDALIVSLGESAKVDVARMSKLTGKTTQEIVDELSDHIILNNDGDYELLDVYTSGNVRKKLEQAKNLANKDHTYQRNVELLERAMPMDKTADEISPQLGSPWLGVETVHSFVEELGVNVNDDNFKITYEPVRGAWKVYTPKEKRGSKYKEFETPRISFYDMLSNALNLKTPTVYDKKEDGGRILNVKATEEARLKAKMLKDKFDDWVFSDSKRRDALVKKYNELFNSNRNMDFEKISKYLNMNDVKNIKLRTHQSKAVARVLFGGDTLLAHGVGSGKTFEMIGASHELIRTGVSNKNIMVVPNHKVTDFEKDYRKMYPDAKILVSTEKDLKPANRIKFFTNIAANEWECVILPHSSFELLPISPQKQAEYIEREIDELRTVIEAMLEESGKSESTRAVKGLYKTLDNKENELKRLLDTPRDNSIYFDEMGLGAIFVDEAHNFKNLTLYTKLQLPNIKGSASQRALDMFIKTGLIREAGGRVVFATATPITNTVSEMYNMMRFVRPDVLKDAGISSFDGWATTFGQVEMKMEMSPDAKSFRAKERFVKYRNVQSMIGMFRQFADVVKTGDVIDSLPNVERIDVLSEGNDQMSAFLDSIQERIEGIKRSGSGKDDNMLLITSDGRAAATDIRLIAKLLGESDLDLDLPGSKINKAADNIYKVYKDTAKTKGTQIVFLDFGIHAKEDGRYNFNLYEDLIAKLVKYGIPRAQIATIHEAKTNKTKAELFENVNSGKVRVLIGSTAKMGEGMNAQERAVALHHLNAPYRPSDIEQREGRIIRQGNSNKSVKIFNYIQELSLDSVMWQTLSRKATFISQAMAGEFTGMELDEVDEFVASANLIMAVATGNPLIMKKVDVDQKVSELQGFKQAYRRNTYKYDDIVVKNPESIKSTQGYIVKMEKDLATYEKNTLDKFTVELNGKMFDEREAAGAAIHEATKKTNFNYTKIGSYNGFELGYITREWGNLYTPRLILKGNTDYNVDISSSNIGTTTRLENLLKGISGTIESFERNVKEKEAELEDAKRILAQPFKYEADLSEALTLQQSINTQLGIGVAEIINEDAVGDFEDSDSSDSPDAYVPWGPEASIRNQYSWGHGQKIKPVHEIMVDIRKSFKVGISNTRFKNRKAYAHYKSFPQVIESKIVNTLEPLMHELGHHFDHKYNLKTSIFIKDMISKMPAEFLVNYPDPAKHKTEAVAEFMRLYMTSPDDAMVFSSGFYEQFETTLSPADLKNIHRIRGDVMKWLDASIQDQIKSTRVSRLSKKSIAVMVSEIKDNFEMARKKAYMFLFDELQPLNGFARYIEKTTGVDLKAENDPYELALFSLKSTTRARAIAVDNMINPFGEVIGVPFRVIMDGITVKNYSDFNNYLIAKRALDYHARGKRTFSDDIPISYVESMVADYESTMPELKVAADKLYAWWTRFTEAWVVETGLMDSALYEHMQELEPHYVPFFRQRQEDVMIGDAIRQLARRGYVDHRSPLKRSSKDGSSDPIYNPIESMLAEIERYVTTVDRRNVMLAVHESYMKLMASKDTTSGIGTIMNKVAPNMDVSKVNMKDKKNELAMTLYDEFAKTLTIGEKLEFETLKKDAMEMRIPFDAMLNYLHAKGFNAMSVVNEIIDDTVLEFKAADFDKETNIITIKDREGKTHHYEIFDRFLLEALLNNDISNLDTATRIVSSIRRSVQAVTTSFNPIFIAKNLSRDTGTGFTFADIPMHEYHARLISSIVQQLTDGEWAVKYRSAGGGFSGQIGADRNALEQTVADIVPGWEKKHPLKTILHAMESFSDALEQAPRLAQFTHHIEKNGGDISSIIEAMNKASDVTVNFNKKGQIMRRWYGNVIPFLNPALQGIDKTVRMHSKEKAPKTIIRAIVGITIGTLLLYAINRQDDEYKKLSNYIKDNHYLFYQGTPGRYIRVPKPQGIGMLYGASFERLIESAIEKNPDAWGGFLENLVNAFMPPVEPITKGYTDAKNNKTWYDGEIVPYAYQRLQKDQQYDDKTSYFAKQIAKLIPDNSNFSSPMIIDYVIGQYTGIIGKVAIPFTDDVKGNGFEFAIRSFTTDVAYSNNVVPKFYDRLKSMESVIDTVKFGRMPKDAKQVAAYPLYKETNEAIKELRALHDQLDKMDADTYATITKEVAIPKEKFKRLLKLEILKIAEQANRTYDSYVK